MRDGRIRYQCKECGKWFSVNRKAGLDISRMTLDHLDGMPLRKIADRYKVSISSAFSKVRSYLDKLPNCADVTRKYCSRFSGILVVDGKFVCVRGYEKKIPTFYGIDYLSHDIPTFKLMPSENYEACVNYFKSLRLLNYPLRALVSDDNPNIREACLAIYPNAIIQICQNHYLENVRKTLNVRTDPTYTPFMRRVEVLFKFKRSKDDFNRYAKTILNDYQDFSICVAVMIDIHKKKGLLLGYLNCKHCPRTTNIIESFNSHLNARLESIKGFKSFRSADLWLNGYFLRRRIKRFTDCRGKFKHLNGKKSLEQTQKCDVVIPPLF